MKKTLAFVLAAAMMPAAFANLLTNGDLELGTGVDDANGWTIYEGDSTGAVFNTAEIVGFANHTPGGNRGFWFRAFMGGASFGSTNPVDAFLFQEVAASAGQSYTLSAWFLMEQNYSGLDSNLDTTSFLAMQYLDANDQVLGFDLIDVDEVYNAQAGGWQQFSVTGTALTGTVTMQAGADFQNGQFTRDPGQSAFVDDFHLAAVPEPATMSALALGAMALIRRRRSR